MYYVGVDYHRRFSYLTVMDKKGKILKEAKLPNTKEALHTFFKNTLNGSSKKTKTVLEVGRNWQVMHDLLEEELGEVKLAHSYKIKAIASAKIKTDKYVKRLLTIPGIGKFFSVLIAYEADNIERFPDEKKFASYIGIIPSTYASGSFLRYGRITSQGNRYLKWALIEAIWPAINKSNYLRTHYERIRKEKGANKAKVTTARRLANIIYRVLSEDRSYIEKYPAASY